MPFFSGGEEVQTLADAFPELMLIITLELAYELGTRAKALEGALGDTATDCADMVVLL